MKGTLITPGGSQTGQRELRRAVIRERHLWADRGSGPCSAILTLVLRSECLLRQAGLTVDSTLGERPPP